MKYNNIVLTIVPESLEGTIEGYKDEDCIRASWCYLHGQLESKNGYDIFSLLKSEILPEHQDDKWLSYSFPEGEYECICFNQPCTFFYWTRRGHGGGLVVFNSDKELYEDAKAKFERRETCI